MAYRPLLSLIEPINADEYCLHIVLCLADLMECASIQMLYIHFGNLYKFSNVNH